MRGDVDEIAGFELDRFRRVFEAQRCLTLQDDHPLTLGLVVPEALRARLAGGDDALDAQAGAVEQI